MSGPAAIRRLGAEDVQAAAETLAGAFRDYPVMRFVIGTDAPAYERRVSALTRFFVEVRRLRGEPILGIPSRSGFGAVALVSDPDGPESPPEVSALREELWSKLGPLSRARYEAFGRACAPLLVDVPRIHLNMIGVAAADRGRGLGGRLLDRVHDLSLERPGCEGVSLTTEDPGNLPLYQRFGYEITGHSEVAAGLETWALFRPVRGGATSARA